MSKKRAWDSCKTCVHAVDPTQSYGICLRTHTYIRETLQSGICDRTFKGWEAKPGIVIRTIAWLERQV